MSANNYFFVYQARRAGFKSPGSSAFTIIESVVVVLMLGILAVLITPNFTAVQRKAEGVVCSSRLRNLWTTFSANLSDGNAWPQLPTNIVVGSEAEQQWWLNYSSNNGLGLTTTAWQCPTIARMQHSATNTQQIALISYYPTLFDAKPMTPRNWPRMPWFVEIGNVHGAGALSVRSDGSVCPVQDP